MRYAVPDREQPAAEPPDQAAPLADDGHADDGLDLARTLARATARSTPGRKKAVRRAKKISNAHIFEAVITRDAARGRFIDELLGMFGWRMQPLMAHLIESGKLTLNDVKEAEEALKKLAKKGKSDE